jgi:hypothetical protein
MLDWQWLLASLVTSHDEPLPCVSPPESPRSDSHRNGQCPESRAAGPLLGVAGSVSVAAVVVLPSGCCRLGFSLIFCGIAQRRDVAGYIPA